MAKKVIALKEPTVLEIQFSDGKTLEGSFNMKAIRILMEEFGGLLDIFNKAVNDIPGATAKILYATLKTNNEDLTFKDVQALTDCMGVSDAMAIIELCTEGISNKLSPEELKKTAIEMFGAKK